MSGSVVGKAQGLHDACAEVAATYDDSNRSDPWKGSAYEWIRNLSSRKKGAAGEKIVERWLSANGFTVQPPGSSEADRRVNGHPVEVKLSTEWESGVFTFQQLRDQEYTHVILLGVRPSSLQLWCVPKAIVLQHATGQHTGGTATETMWLSFPADTPPEWLDGYGGSDAAALASAATSFPAIES
jgi:hypothetical protein